MFFMGCRVDTGMIGDCAYSSLPAATRGNPAHIRVDLPTEHEYFINVVPNALVSQPAFDCNLHQSSRVRCFEGSKAVIISSS